MLGAPPRAGHALLWDREPSTAPATLTSVIDEQLHIASGSVADLSGWRSTAVPAGSRGRITASGGRLYEAGVPVRFNVAQFSPDNYAPVPLDRSVTDAGVAYLARAGYNCLRIMGLEHQAMRGVDGALTFLPEVLDAFWYMLARCKAEGVYVVLSVMSYNLYRDMDGNLSRYDRTPATNLKARIYTEQDIRDQWLAGARALYGVVNPYTGVNIAADPSIVLFECYNEATAHFNGQFGMPDFWVANRSAGATPAAKLWLEWLSDSTAAHGYANLAALNASWGTSHATFAAAAAQSVPLMKLDDVVATQQMIDWALYLRYLDEDMAQWYVWAFEQLGYPGLRSQHTIYTQMAEVRVTQKSPADDVVNLHGYLNLTNEWSAGPPTQNINVPPWGYMPPTAITQVSVVYIGLMPTWCGGAKPVWMGEMGDVSFSKWRHIWPLIGAMGAAGGAVAGSFYTQGDFFTPALFNDLTFRGERFSKMHAFHAPASFTNDFVRVMQAAIWCRGDVPEMTGTLTVPVNDRYFGVSPRNTGRLWRYLAGLLRPMYPAAALARARLVWQDDTADDTMASTWQPKTWAAHCTELRDSGAIAADHPTLLSALANTGTITAVAVSGTVGGLAASLTQPVLTLAPSHTLVDDDIIHISTMSGTMGTAQAYARTVVKVGTGNAVRCETGFDLTGHSDYGTGTWCEGDNILQAGNDSYRISRRERMAWINTARSVYFTHGGATLPVTLGIVTVVALDADTSVFVTSADGLDLTSSRRLLLGLCGWAQNTGMDFTDETRTVMTSTGDYPVQQTDCTATIDLELAAAPQWVLYRVARSGERVVREAPTVYNASTKMLRIKLRTGTIHPAVLWELVRP